MRTAASQPASSCTRPGANQPGTPSAASSCSSSSLHPSSRRRRRRPSSARPLHAPPHTHHTPRTTPSAARSLHRSLPRFIFATCTRYYNHRPSFLSPAVNHSTGNTPASACRDSSSPPSASPLLLPPAPPCLDSSRPVGRLSARPPAISEAPCFRRQLLRCTPGLPACRGSFLNATTTTTPLSVTPLPSTNPSRPVCRQLGPGRCRYSDHGKLWVRCPCA